MTEKINKTRDQFFIKINEIDKTQVKLIKKNRKDMSY